MKCKEDYALFLVVLLGLCLWLCAAQKTDPAEVNALLKIKGSLGDPFNNLKNWKSKDDPCNKPWRGVLCPNTTDGKGRRHVTQLQLLNMNLTGNLASEIGDLQELRILNFMWNNITGNIPREIGSIAALKLLLLNGNKLSGPLPEELGNLRNLDRIQIDQNNIQGSLPKSFANLNKTKHFHMNNNSLSGEIPKEFSRLGSLVHLLLDNNNLSGKLPPDLAKIPNLLILQLDNNQFENSEIPQEYGNISTLLKLSLRNCSLHGPLPDFSSIPQLGYLDLSYNKLTGNIPSGNLSKAMTTIVLSHNNLNGSIPSSFASLPLLQKLSLNDNNLVGSAPTDIGSNIVLNSTAKLVVDFRNNSLTNLSNTAILRSLPPNVTFLLDGNPVCIANNMEIGRYCSSSNVSEDSNGLSINTKCSPKLCSPPAEPFGSNCYCSYPFKVGYRLKSPGISAFPSYKDVFEDYITSGLNLSLDQVAVQSYEWQPGPRLGMYLNVFPLANQTYRKFNDSEILRIRDQFAGWLIPDSDVFGPYEWINFTLGEEYANVYEGSNGSGLTKGALAGVLVGTVLGTLIISALIGIVAFKRYTKYTRGVERRRRARKRVKVSGVRDFEFQEMASATNSFDALMKIGKGGYGDVYKGLLEDGTVVAIKRAREGSLQGEKEFANEIELLSRLHHRNLVSLVGYCDDQDEQMLVYEYMPNGTLTDHLSEPLRQRPLTFTTRLRIALGAAKGIFYLHTEANPPIFHRDIKATNILLDERFNARVADFGLSRLAPQPELEGNAPGYVSTVVKGTPGYLDPEYFLTHKLTDKSDVYSFGVVLLELLTAMKPITNGKNLVREVLAAYTSRDIPSIIDPRMGSYPPECLEPFLKLSLSCCKDETDLRPSIAEVVQELTRILQCVAADEERESLQMSSNSQRDLYDPYLSSDVSGIELHSASDPIVMPR